MKAVVWNEGRHEQSDGAVRRRYPGGIHGALAGALREHLGADVEVLTRTLDDPAQGLRPADVADADVLLWWGHLAHDEVSDPAVSLVQDLVLHGLGLVVLHSGHASKVFKRLMGTSCSLLWRNAGERELIWTVAPGHPIVEGVPSPVVLDAHEMYGELFDVPPPDELLLVSSFAGGEVFRGGATWRRGAGRVVYLSPGDQDYPVYHHGHVRRLVANAAAWAARRSAHDGSGPVDPYALHRPEPDWFVTS